MWACRTLWPKIVIDIREMSMSSSERLRLRMAATTKIISPRPLKDSSMLTAVNRYKNTTIPTQRQSDGQQLSYSSEVVAAARAGCAICTSPPATTVTIACCPIPDGPKAAALQGKRMGCCPYQGGRPAEPECCSTPGNVNTWWANDIPAGYVVALPLCHPCPPPPTEHLCPCECHCPPLPGEPQPCCLCPC
jgi:hypothetical protein